MSFRGIASENRVHIFMVVSMYLYPSDGGLINPTISTQIVENGVLIKGSFPIGATRNYVSGHTLMYTWPIKLLLDSTQRFGRPPLLCPASNVSCATDTTFSRISVGTTN